MMRIRLIVEGRDLDKSILSIECLRFLEAAIGIEPQRAQAEASRMRFQRFEDAPADAEPARVGRNPEPLDLADPALFPSQRTATDRPAAEPCDDEDAVRRRELGSIHADALGRIESGFETLRELIEVLLNAPARVAAVRPFRLYLNGRHLDEPLDLPHRRDQAVPLGLAERSQDGFRQLI